MKVVKKIWRKLTFKEKHNLLLGEFGFDENEIKHIRNCTEPRKKLIEAARLQYESFKDIHTDLTAWISGYSSDAAVRNYFGSSKKLREFFITPSIHHDSIQPSWQDIKRRVKIPEHIDKSVAKDVGIHIGDGNLDNTPDPRNGSNYRYRVDGHLIDEILYHQETIQPLMILLYNLPGFFVKNARKKSIQSCFSSKALFEFKHKKLGLPVGNKEHIAIPQEILTVDELFKECLAGIIDTDFTLTADLKLVGTLHSPVLMRSIRRRLADVKIASKLTINGLVCRLSISKKGSLEIIEEWKLQNDKHLSKYTILNEFGISLPYTTTPERLALIDGKITLEELQLLSKKRRELRHKDRSSVDASNQKFETAPKGTAFSNW